MQAMSCISEAAKRRIARLQQPEVVEKIKTLDTCVGKRQQMVVCTSKITSPQEFGSVKACPRAGGDLC